MMNLYILDIEDLYSLIEEYKQVIKIFNNKCKPIYRKDTKRIRDRIKEIREDIATIKAIIREQKLVDERYRIFIKMLNRSFNPFVGELRIVKTYDNEFYSNQIRIVYKSGSVLKLRGPLVERYLEEVSDKKDICPV